MSEKEPMDRLERFFELVMLGAVLPLLAIAVIALSPLALLGWVSVKPREPKEKP